MKAYVVYELQPMRPRRDRDDLAGERLPVKHSLQLVGCFIADSEGQAIRAAAESQQRSANYVAVDAKVQQAQFAEAGPAQLKALSGLEPDEHEGLASAVRKLRKAMEAAAEKPRA